MTANKARKACIFCNGRLNGPARGKQIAEDCDLLIAVDGGTRYCAELGLTPHVIIGNADSNGSGKWENNPGIERIRYPIDKDKSDAELAVEYALGHGCEQGTLVAATGRRLDHTLGNVALLASHPGRVALFDGTSTLVAVDKSEKCPLHGQVGTRVSLIPYGSGSPRVRTNGLVYSLQEECLKSATQGLSNELSQTETCICVSNGIMLVYIENQDVHP
ncbi:MAG: thiamine diphosphokinase [Sedimentisphaerales bacterium]